MTPGQFLTINNGPSTLLVAWTAVVAMELNYIPPGSSAGNSPAGNNGHVRIGFDSVIPGLLPQTLDITRQADCENIRTQCRVVQQLGPALRQAGATARAVTGATARAVTGTGGGTGETAEPAGGTGTVARTMRRRGPNKTTAQKKAAAKAADKVLVAGG